jgi:hypothetical protein
MAFNLTIIVRQAMNTAFRLGPPLIRAGTYHRPPTVNVAEAAVPCSFLSTAVRSTGFLGLVHLAPGTELILVRSSELASIVEPVGGDYVVESATGIRRNIEGARLDVTGEFYTFQTVRSADEDWGDLTTHTVAEDFGDLTAATAFEDRMALN